MSDTDPTITGVPDKAERSYVLEEQIGFLLRVVSQRHAAIFQSFSPDGLTPRQFSVLVRIAEVGSCSQNHLGRLTAMDVATIKGVVDRLKLKGLVSLAPDASDKRRTSIRLTPQAARMIETLHTIGLEISTQTVAPLTTSETATLVKLLKKIS